MPHLAKQRQTQLYRLLSIFIILVFVVTLNKVSLPPSWAALGPIVQDFLCLLKDSDVVALIQVDDPKCKEAIDDHRNFCQQEAAVHFKFSKVYRGASWCKVATNVPQVLITPYNFQNQKQYVVFLQASTDNNQWWDISDPWMFLPVDQEQIRGAGKKCRDLFADDIYGKILNATDVRLSDFENRLKIVCSSIPEVAKHKLHSTEKYLKLWATQAEINKIMRKWQYCGNCDPMPFIENMSIVINIKPAKEPLLQRAWAYLFLGRVDSAISDVNAAMRTEMRDPNVVPDERPIDWGLGMPDSVKALPMGSITCPYDPWSKHYRFAEYVTRAYAYVHTNRLREAAADCEAAAQCCPDPGWDSGCAVLPLCLFHMGRYKQAKDICDQIIANRLSENQRIANACHIQKCEDPGIFLYIVRAHAYIGLKDYKKALADCEQACNLYNNENWHESYSMDRGPAAFTYRTMLREPDCSSALLARADALNDLRRYKEAKETVDQIIASAPHLKNVCGIGLTITSCKDKPATICDVMEDGPAHKSGLLAGDQIVEIDGKQTKGWPSEEIANHIRGPKGTPVALSINRAGKPLKFTINRTYENLGRFDDSAPLLLRASELRGKLCKELGLSSEAEKSFAEARELKHVEQR
jgi:tetratricopeptide (TPR) repeat protein